MFDANLPPSERYILKDLIVHHCPGTQIYGVEVCQSVRDVCNLWGILKQYTSFPSTPLFLLLQGVPLSTHRSLALLFQC